MTIEKPLAYYQGFFMHFGQNCLVLSGEIDSGNEGNPESAHSLQPLESTA